MDVSTSKEDKDVREYTSREVLDGFLLFSINCKTTIKIASNSISSVYASKPLTARRVMIFSLVSFVYFLTWCCVGMWAPFFPEEAAKRGVSSTEVGFIFGAYCLVSFLSSLVYGPLVIPHIGPYFVLFAGLFLCGGASLVCGFVNLIQDHLPFAILCFLVRAIGALGGSACETTIVVILTQEFPENIAFAIGLLEVFAGLGFIIGPVLGGFLYSLGGFRLPMFAVGGALLVFLPIIWLLLPRQDYMKMESGNQNQFNLFKQSITTPGVIIMCLSSAICMISLSFLEPTLQPHAKTLGVGSMGVALLFLACSGAFTLSSPFAGYILNRKSCGRVLIVIGSIGAAVGMLFLGPAPFLKLLVPKKCGDVISDYCHYPSLASSFDIIQYTLIHRNL